MVHCLRALWVLCPHYAAPERMVELLRQLGVQVIGCCARAIPLPALLAGDVTAGIAVLQEVGGAGGRRQWLAGWVRQWPVCGVLGLEIDVHALPCAMPSGVAMPAAQTFGAWIAGCKAVAETQQPAQAAGRLGTVKPL